MRTRFAWLWLLACGAAHADVYTVTKSADSNDGACDADCSLREAVAAANARPGADEIRLKHSFYRLTVHVTGPNDSALFISDPLVIRGLASRSTIDANATNRHFTIYNDTKVELIDLTLRNGAGVGYGGSIYNSKGAELTLRRTWVIGNRVVVDEDGAVNGGGIYNIGTLRVVLGKIERNVAMDTSTFRGGRGGGIHNSPTGVLYLYDTLVRDNRTGEDDSNGYGAGLYNRGRARIDRSFFGANTPGGGEGGAIANRPNGSLAVFNTTISNNGHDGAQGAVANGSVQEPELDDFYPRPIALLANVTIANNNGGGYLNTGRTTMRNAFVAGNYSQDGNDRYYNTGSNCVHRGADEDFVQTYTVMGTGSCPGRTFVDDSTVFTEWLEHLRYLGGPSPVHRPTNPVLVDGGDPDYCTPTDQRRVARPQDGDGDGTAVCDIGAMELQPGE